MKLSKLRKRLRKRRPMKTISLRIPEDVIDDLRRVAPARGFSGYQPLMRAYVGQGLRHDLAYLEKAPALADFIRSLRRHGVRQRVIASAIAETKGSAA